MQHKRKVAEDFEIVKQLGKGAFGQVKLARNRKTGVLEVIKRIDIGSKDNKLEIELTKNEIEMLIKCVRNRLM
jgi:serine/threonine protein kinase